jgi:ribosomal protein L11 methylase PrmA
VIVVATIDSEIASVRARLGELGAGVLGIVTPTDRRRLVLATANDESEAARVAAVLRSEGWMALTRPDGGARLLAWMHHTAPITFDQRLSVCFAWSEHARTDVPGMIELGLGGFGNGRHPTTRLVVEELLDRISGGERVLDVGCGSGVLGLCALRLGASQVVAVDLKPDAVEATRRNGALNGMEGRVHATLAPLGEINDSFDVVVANIGRAAIVDLAPHLVRLMAPRGWLAVSGFSPRQSALVGGFLSPLVEVGRRTSGEWSAVVLVRGPVQPM